VLALGRPQVPISTNRRKNTRHNVRQGARMLRADGSLLGPCVMMDVSAGGARLAVKSSDELPDHFSLVLSRDGQVRRDCWVAWRTGSAIGVEFVPPQSVTRRNKTRQAKALEALCPNVAKIPGS
jgi:hypothetical protein